MSDRISTAMLMCAGFGTRMKALTKAVPKPLLKIGNLTLLEIALRKLENAGIRRVVINLHYQADQLQQFAEKKIRCGMQLLFSREKEILGTGGGIAQAERFFSRETILVANPDVLSAIPLPAFFEYYHQQRAEACMAILPSQNNRDYSLVVFDSNQLTGFLDRGADLPDEPQTGIFTGFQILSASARQNLKPQFSSVISAYYRPALAAGKKIPVFLQKEDWLDVGTENQYRRINSEAAQNRLTLDRFIYL